MQSKKLGRAAAAAGLMALLLPGVATASWWDGGYDGRSDNGYSARRGNDSSTGTHRASPGNEQSPGSGYGSPGEGPPPDDNPPSQCGPSGCTKYTPPPENNPPPQCGQPDCAPPPPSQCGQPDCAPTPPPDCGQPDCAQPPSGSQCGQSGCTKYTPPPENNPPPQCGQPDCAPPPSGSQCGQSGCTKYTPPPENNPPSQCGQSGCTKYTPPPDCGQPACGQAPPPPPPPYVIDSIYGCENSDLADTHLILHKTTVPPPGTPVRPGDEILVDITWSVWDWSGPDLHKALDCVYINGMFVPELSGGEKPTPNDGHFGFHYFVPLDVPPGSEICDQGFVSGPNGWEEYGRAISNVVCFPVDVPPPPPPTSCACTPPAVETTSTTTPEEEQPYSETESERVYQETPPAEAVMPEAHEVLPRTGSGSGAARLAASGLALATLIRRRVRRG